MSARGTDLAAQLRRERLIDMESRLGVYRRRAFSVLALALIASGPWIGFWFLIPLATALIASTIADRLVRTRHHAHRWAAVGWGISGVMIAVSVALTGGAGSPAVMWLALPAVTLGARFELRGVLLGVGFLIALLFLSTMALDPQAVLDRPDSLIFALALVIATAIFSGATQASDREHRREAVLDPLTGLLNRAPARRGLTAGAPAPAPRRRSSTAGIEEAGSAGRKTSHFVPVRPAMRRSTPQRSKTLHDRASRARMRRFTPCRPHSNPLPQCRRTQALAQPRAPALRALAHELAGEPPEQVVHLRAPVDRLLGDELGQQVAPRGDDLVGERPRPPTAVPASLRLAPRETAVAEVTRRLLDFLFSGAVVRPGRRTALHPGRCRPAPRLREGEPQRRVATLLTSIQSLLGVWAKRALQAADEP